MARKQDWEFDYPDKPWSEGKMRMSKAGPRGDPGKEYRELEGIRKRKEQFLSEGGGQKVAQMGREIMSGADIGTGAGAIPGPGSGAIGVMENTLRNQQGLTAAEKKKQGLHPDNMTDEQLFQQYQQGFKSGQPTVLHGSKREMELYMKALDLQGGG